MFDGHYPILIVPRHIGMASIKKQQVKVKVVLSLYTMKAYGGVDVHPHTFLTSTLDGRQWSATRACHLQNSIYNCSHDICWMNKPRRITWAEYVGVGEKRREEKRREEKRREEKRREEKRREEKCLRCLREEI